jgi:hypothetical protein
MREHGAIILDGVQAATTHRCPHCGGHFLKAQGNLELAQKELGSIAHAPVFCIKCGRDTCGRAGCDPAKVGCVPIEARLEHAEGKRTTYDDAIAKLFEAGNPIL